MLDKVQQDALMEEIKKIIKDTEYTQWNYLIDKNQFLLFPLICSIINNPELVEVFPNKKDFSTYSEMTIWLSEVKKTWYDILKSLPWTKLHYEDWYDSIWEYRPCS